MDTESVRQRMREARGKSQLDAEVSKVISSSTKLINMVCIFFIGSLVFSAVAGLIATVGLWIYLS